MRLAIRQAVVPAAVMGLIAAPFFGTPEVITLFILSVAGFISAMIVLIAFWRLTPVASWARWKQRLATWIIALGAAAAGCLLILAPVLFKRLGKWPNHPAAANPAIAASLGDFRQWRGVAGSERSAGLIRI